MLLIHLNHLEKKFGSGLPSRNALKAMVTTINTNAQTAEDIAEQFSSCRLQPILRQRKRRRPALPPLIMP